MIATDAELAAFIKRCLAHDCVGIDTEFVWERTYYPVLGLIQIGLPNGEVGLIDPIACEDLEPMAVLLSNMQTCKIFHDAQQDLILLNRVTGTQAVNVFDTRLAAGFCGLSSTLSLANLCANLVAVELCKESTRTNWLDRPLSEKQLEYAANDVRYLPQMYKLLSERAEQAGYREWLSQDLRMNFGAKLYEVRSNAELFERVSGCGKLSRAELSVLRELASLREDIAQELDLPRSWVASDIWLVVTAQGRAWKAQPQKGRKLIFEKDYKVFESRICEAIERGKNASPDSWPEARRGLPEEPWLKESIAQATAFLRGRCSKMQIDSALVANKAHLKEIVLAAKQSLPFASIETGGWRDAFYKEALYQKMVEKFHG